MWTSPRLGRQFLTLETVNPNSTSQMKKMAIIIYDHSAGSTVSDFNLLADSTDDALGFRFLVAKYEDNLQAQPEDKQHRKHRICANDILAHYHVARSNLFFLSNNFYSYSMENFKYSNCKNLRTKNIFLNDTINY